MSRIGRKPILIESNIKVSIDRDTVDIEGPCGKMKLSIPPQLAVVKRDNLLEIKIKKGEGKAASLYGLFRSLLQNAVLGVKRQWQKTLEMVGVGFRGETDGKELVLSLGFSHPVKVTAPEAIRFVVEENKIKVLGVDRYLVGEMAARIRRIKPPEPYKGKGIRYEGEFIRKKLGKAAKTVTVVGGAAK